MEKKKEGVYTWQEHWQSQIYHTHFYIWAIHNKCMGYDSNPELHFENTKNYPIKG